MKLNDAVLVKNTIKNNSVESLKSSGIKYDWMKVEEVKNSAMAVSVHS